MIIDPEEVEWNEGPVLVVPQGRIQIDKRWVRMQVENFQHANHVVHGHQIAVVPLEGGRAHRERQA
jgi:hypothetical protein